MMLIYVQSKILSFLSGEFSDNNEYKKPFYICIQYFDFFSTYMKMLLYLYVDIFIQCMYSCFNKKLSALVN